MGLYDFDISTSLFQGGTSGKFWKEIGLFSSGTNLKESPQPSTYELLSPRDFSAGSKDVFV